MVVGGSMAVVSIEGGNTHIPPPRQASPATPPKEGNFGRGARRAGYSPPLEGCPKGGVVVGGSMAVIFIMPIPGEGSGMAVTGTWQAEKKPLSSVGEGLFEGSTVGFGRLGHATSTKTIPVSHRACQSGESYPPTVSFPPVPQWPSCHRVPSWHSIHRHPGCPPSAYTDDRLR